MPSESLNSTHPSGSGSDLVGRRKYRGGGGKVREERREERRGEKRGCCVTRGLGGRVGGGDGVCEEKDGGGEGGEL